MKPAEMFGKNACVVELFNNNQMSIIVWGITSCYPITLSQFLFFSKVNCENKP